ncbi:hypothetical protein FB45DRAFT_936341 [Roridomyces roridus]|uniref:Xylanolytic transcriptional activator regulatory domain-containing protein n=1 Tax=Roridomyces roridus TaxID=1738132 RepID=A0AAD7B9Q8_9AGAR|nr:hypothetical protein FB45DRAFT_936341 [Roridomyces roridus]
MASPPAKTKYIHKACMNCQRRKTVGPLDFYLKSSSIQPQRCDATRPACGQCLLRPPRLGTPCRYQHLLPGAREQSPAGLEASLLWEPCAFSPVPQIASHPSREQYARRPLMYFSTHTGYGLEFFLHGFGCRHLFFLNPFTLLYPRGISRGLSCVLHLWINHIGHAEANDHDRTLLAFARGQLNNISELEDPVGVLQTMQAVLLLSLYFLDVAHLGLGRYYCAIATSLAFTARLHRLGSPPQTSFPSFAFSDRLPMPTTIEQRREMIDAFWSVVILNNYWVAASGLPSFIPCDVSIITPWPKAPLALLAQASILLERTIAFVGNDSGPNTFSPLGHRLDCFLTLLQRHELPAEGKHMRLVTYALLSTAILRLNAPRMVQGHEDARVKCFDAVRALCLFVPIVEGTGPQWGCSDPIFVPIYTCLAEFYLTWLDPGGVEMQTAITILQTLASRCPLARHCLLRLTGRFNGL